jgi:cytochrome d ubiquinol oxidase subunit I
VRRDPTNAFHRRALQVALIVGVPAALVQPLSGDLSARDVAKRQPVKFAAMEAHFETSGHVPFVIGGIPNAETGELKYAIKIPNALSLLMTGSASTVIPGLDAVPPEDRPPVGVVHIAFQVMVALGSYMALLSLWVVWHWVRKREFSRTPLLLMGLILGAPCGIIAVEAGWIVTEVGRQPWIVHNLIRTADAVTPVPGLIVPMVGFTLLYAFLGVVVVALLRRQIIRSPGAPMEAFETREFAVLPAKPE